MAVFPKGSFVFVPVFLLPESSDGMLVATGCVAEIRLPGPVGRGAGHGEPRWGQGRLGEGAGQPPERRWQTPERRGGPLQIGLLNPLGKGQSSSHSFAEGEGSIGSLRIERLTSTHLIHVPRA